MTKQPLISIIIPCYNHENYVQDCIHSIIEQDYQNIELIIIDDGSQDNSVQKILDIQILCKSRFTRFEFRHRPNKGLCATLNEALEWCQGKYVSIFASDDIMYPHKSSIQVKFLEDNSNITAVFGNMQYFNDNSLLKRTNIPAKEYSFQDVLLHNPLLAPTYMGHLSAIKKVNGYDESIMIEDWYMWLKLLDHGFRIQTIEDVLVKYRWHGDNMSSNAKKMAIAEKQVIDLYKEHPLYNKAYYMVKRNYIKKYRDNGKKIIYYILKYMLIVKFFFWKRVD